jgi:hypothetical protein
MTTGERRRSAAMVVLAAAMVAVFAAAVPPTGGYSYGRGDRSVYDLSTVFLLSLLLVGGVSMLFADRAARRVGAILGLAAGAQLAGTGVVAFRRWHTSGGFTNAADNEGLLRVLAIVLAGAGATAALVSLVVLHREGVFAGVGRRRGLAIAAAVAAVGLAIAVPLAMGHDYGGERLMQGGAHALMYGLPWAVVLFVGALADRISAIAAALVVIASAFPLLDEVLMIPASRPSAGFVVAAIAASAVAITALSTGRPHPQPHRRNTGVQPPRQ